MTKQWRLKTHSEEDIRACERLMEEVRVNPVICRLLVRRGITTADGVKKFFRPRLEDLNDPFLMPDMNKAVKRLNKALGNNEKIIIWGDYDVD